MDDVKNKIACAVDIGETKTLVGLVTGDGKIIAKKRFETNIADDPYDHLKKCIQLISDCIEENNLYEQSISGIGTSVPGLADSQNGILIKAPYAGWTNIRVNEFFSCFYPGKKLMLANDVNACALGELAFGEGKKYSNYVWVTISTGIGAGLVLNGKIFEGEHGIAGELGHAVVEWEHGLKCTCGNKGCLEAHVSGNAIAKIAQKKCLNNNTSLLNQYFRNNSLKITAENVARAARDGVKEAGEIYDAAARYAGKAFSYAVNLINPGCIFIGGGVGLSFDLLGPGIKEVMRNSVIGETNKNTPVIATPNSLSINYFDIKEKRVTAQIHIFTCIQKSDILNKTKPDRFMGFAFLDS